MTRYAIDAPTLLHLVDSGRPINPAHQLVAPNTIRSHALALLYGAVHRGDLTEPEALSLHDRITEVKMRLLGDRVSRRTAWTIARDGKWATIDDAEYLAIARLQADALVTVSAELTVKAHGVVPVAPVEALFSD